MRVFCESVFAATSHCSQTSQRRTKGRRRCCRPGLIDASCMHLVCPYWGWHLETASEGDPRARGNVGSGDLADQKTTARAAERVPGSLTYPLDAAVDADGRLGRLGGGRTRAQRAQPPPARGRASLAETRLGCLSGGTRTPRRVSPGTTGRAGPTAGRTHRIWRGERKVRPLLQFKVRRVETY